MARFVNDEDEDDVVVVVVDVDNRDVLPTRLARRLDAKARKSAEGKRRRRDLEDVNDDDDDDGNVPAALPRMVDTIPTFSLPKCPSWLLLSVGNKD